MAKTTVSAKSGNTDLPPIRAVLFDAGHTLVFPDLDVYGQVAMGAGAPSPSREMILAAELVARHEFERLTAEKHEFPHHWSLFYGIMFRLLRVPAENLHEAIRDLYHRHRQGFGLWNQPAPGAAETLAALSRAGYLLGVVSNSDGRAEEGLEAVGLRRYLSFVLDSQVLGIAKPDPRIFQLALERAGTAAAETMFVGDYVSVDIVGAQAVGMIPVLYDPVLAYENPGCLVISRLEELTALLPEGVG